MFDSNADIRIGQYTESTHDFEGWIDELRITKGIARYTSDFIPPTDKAFPRYSSAVELYSDLILEAEPLAYYRFGEPSGSVVEDSSGNTNDATYAGTVSLGEPGLQSTDDDTCVDFLGTGYADNLVETDNVSAVAFEFILGPVTGTTEQRIYDWQDDSGFFLCRVNSPSTGRIAALVQVGSNVEIDAAIDLTEPHHIAVKQTENGEFKLFVDGAIVASDTLGGTFSSPSTARRIGQTRNASTFNLNAKLDEFVVYNYAPDDTVFQTHATLAGYL